MTRERSFGDDVIRMIEVDVNVCVCVCVCMCTLRIHDELLKREEMTQQVRHTLVSAPAQNTRRGHSQTPHPHPPSLSLSLSLSLSFSLSFSLSRSHLAGGRSLVRQLWFCFGKNGCCLFSNTLTTSQQKRERESHRYANVCASLVL